ncbi:polyprenyl synthetase family protein [Spongorhabdus nitratireducens]
MPARASVQALFDPVAGDFSAVNDYIKERLASDVGLVQTISHYIVQSGGKRLRPLLVLLAARACGYQGNKHIHLAASIEFLHTATLLHDDVVDTSDLRRGRSTANAKWGNAPSVLVGDFLHSRAFQMMVSIGDMPVMEVLAHATCVIAEGEVQQLMNIRDASITEECYMEVIRSKTAMLFEASSQTAALLSDVSSELTEDMRQYGNHLGLAFQLVDDALDYTGNSEELGKNVGDDLEEGKPTLPLIQAMKCGTEEQKTLVRQAIQQGGREHFEAVIEAVRESGALDYTTAKARYHAEMAAGYLNRLEESPYKDALLELTRFAVARTN